jgi:hypothetical protein
MAGRTGPRWRIGLVWGRTAGLEETGVNRATRRVASGVNSQYWTKRLRREGGAFWVGSRGFVQTGFPIGLAMRKPLSIVPVGNRSDRFVFRW